MSRVGVVLGAGGVLGAAWSTGALQALTEVVGLDPREAEVLVGTSAGSVLAASLGCGMSVATLANHQAGTPAADDPVLEYDYDHDSGGSLPPLPKLGIGSAGLLLEATVHPWRVTPMAALASLLPQGRGSLAPVGGVIDALLDATSDGGADDAWATHPNTWVVAMDYRTGKRTAFGRAGSPTARLSQAVMASCSIPGWFAPQVIGGRPYVDGGACSPTSLDLVLPLELDTVYVVSPMTSLHYDDPSSVAARLERQVRRLVTRRLVREAAKVRRTGTNVVLLGPGPEDLQAIGANLMDPKRREQVFETSVRTSRAALASDFAATG
jgi:NTE family protein